MLGLVKYFDIIGFEASSPIKSFLTGLKHSFSVDKNAKRAFQMVIFDTDDNGKAVDAFKIRLIDGIDEIFNSKGQFLQSVMNFSIYFKKSGIKVNDCWWQITEHLK